MIRRMKDDILELPPKKRENEYIDLEDKHEIDEIRQYMHQLGSGCGVLSIITQLYYCDQTISNKIWDINPHHLDKDDVSKKKPVLTQLYMRTGKSKVKYIIKKLRAWLVDPTNGKLCIFAHHKIVMNDIEKALEGVLGENSTTKYIRIDGDTSMNDRKLEIDKFQSNANVRIAILSITAANVAITLTASSTVWFAELYWTPGGH